MLRDDAPQECAAVDDLIAKANAADPLYVVAIGALTNIASAILKDPSIIERIVVVWLGGHALYWPTADEFNLQGDLVAAQVVFDCGVPFVQNPMPPRGLTPADDTDRTGALRQGTGGNWRLSGRNIRRLCPKSLRRFQGNLGHVSDPLGCSTHRGYPTDMVHSPVLTDQKTWSHDPSRHFMRVARTVRRDPIFGDLFKKLDRLLSPADRRIE